MYSYSVLCFWYEDHKNNIWDFRKFRRSPGDRIQMSLFSYQMVLCLCAFVFFTCLYLRGLAWFLAPVLPLDSYVALWFSLGFSFLISKMIGGVTDFMYLFKFLAVLGLHWCAWAFSSCSMRSFHCDGFSRGAQAPRHAGSVVVADRISGMWNLPWPGIKPVFLHWQVDS